MNDFSLAGDIASRLSRPNAPQAPDFDSLMQSIASAAHRRGVDLMRGAERETDLDAGTLCTTLRRAWTIDTNLVRRTAVLKLARGIVASLGQRGTVQVSAAAWQQILKHADGRGLGVPEQPKRRGEE